jgi:hypothetical protein
MIAYFDELEGGACGACVLERRCVTFASVFLESLNQRRIKW